MKPYFQKRMVCRSSCLLKKMTCCLSCYFFHIVFGYLRNNLEWSFFSHLICCFTHHHRQEALFSSHLTSYLTYIPFFFCLHLINVMPKPTKNPAKLVNKPVEYNNILVLFKPICGREGDKV